MMWIMQIGPHYFMVNVFWLSIHCRPFCLIYCFQPSVISVGWFYWLWFCYNPFLNFQDGHSLKHIHQAVAYIQLGNLKHWYPCKYMHIEYLMIQLHSWISLCCWSSNIEDIHCFWWIHSASSHIYYWLNNWSLDLTTWF